MAAKAQLVLVDPKAPAMALDVPKGQSFDDWVEMGRRLAETDRRLQWWIGDWWAAGTHRYGARAKAAAEGIFGREFQTLMNAASVCRSFEPSRRRDDVSWSHHVEVAALPAEEADALLNKVEAEDLSVRELRIQAMKRKVALGIFRPRDRREDDPEDDDYAAIARKWNRASMGARVKILEAIEEWGAITIDRQDALFDNEGEPREIPL